MGPFEVLWIATVFGGYAFGYWVAKIQMEKVFKRFSVEMHRQYLSLLKRHGIKIKPEYEAMINEPNHKSEREEGVLRMWSEDRNVDDGR